MLKPSLCSELIPQIQQATSPCPLATGGAISPSAHLKEILAPRTATPPEPQREAALAHVAMVKETALEQVATARVMAPAQLMALVEAGQHPPE